MKKYIVITTLLVAALLLSACTPEEPKKEGTATPPAATTQAASPAATTPAPTTPAAKPTEPAKPATTQTTATKPTEPVKPTTTTPAPVKPAEPVATTPTQPAPVTSSAQGNASNGSAVYKKSCAGCHGNTGMGDGPAASSLKPKPADFVSAGYKDSKGKNPREYSDAELKDIIDNGRKGTAMPAWKKQLSAEQISDVIAYIRSLAK